MSAPNASPPASPADYLRVAEIYQEALGRWQPPLRAVADVLGIPYTTAIGRVRKAKKLGLIDSTDRRWRLVDKKPITERTDDQ